MFKAKRKKQNGFTLVELLVVIAIIALLLAVLMPSLQKAKKLAQTAICGSRSKQLSVALMAYTQCYDGFIMPASLQYEKDCVTQVPGYQTDPKLWPPKVAYWYLNLCANKYLPTKDAFFCPDAFPQNYNQFEEYYKAGKTNKRFDEGEAFILGMRDWSYADIGRSYRAPKLLTKLPQPAEFFLVADSINKDYRTVTPVQFYRIMVKERAISEGPYQIGVHARHNNKVSTLFADGHVKLTKMKYFLDIQGPVSRNWQYKYSIPWASTEATRIGYRVFAKHNDEWTYMGVERYYNLVTKQYSSDP